jgi:hypothetical protein
MLGNMLGNLVIDLGNLVIDRSLSRIRLNGSQHPTLILTLLSKIEAPAVHHGLTAGADNAAATCRSDRFRANRFRAQHTAQRRAADRTMARKSRCLDEKKLRRCSHRRPVPKTAEFVAGTLRRMIVDERLEDGDFLPHESELMAQFHVSRPTVREAVRVLESGTTGRGSAQLTNRCAGALTRSRARRMAGWTAARIVRRKRWA